MNKRLVYLIGFIFIVVIVSSTLTIVYTKRVNDDMEKYLPISVDVENNDDKIEFVKSKVYINEMQLKNCNEKKCIIEFQMENTTNKDIILNDSYSLFLYDNDDKILQTASCRSFPNIPANDSVLFEIIVGPSAKYTKRMEIKES